MQIDPANLSDNDRAAIIRVFGEQEAARIFSAVPAAKGGGSIFEAIGRSQRARPTALHEARIGYTMACPAFSSR